MKPQHFKNVKIFDGEGGPLFDGEVLISGKLIERVGVGPGSIEVQPSEVDVIDGEGRTLMPGLVEAHAHITFTNVASLKELGFIPPEEHLLAAAQNARLLLDAGFTSLYSASSAKLRTEVVLRNAINRGELVGPRLRAASPEIVSTGGMGDESRQHASLQTVEFIADGPEELRRGVRSIIREGVDQIKVNLSGAATYDKKGCHTQIPFSEEEVAVIAEEARRRDVALSCHARADEGVRMALRHGFRMIYHCDYVTGDTFDLMEAARDHIFVAPALGVIYAQIYEGDPWGFSRELIADREYPQMLESCLKVCATLKDRGVRVLPGGDYGFAWNPQGTNARDLEHFVNLVGFTPADALMAATKWGGQLMGIPNLGLIRDGYLADLLLVDGDPTVDVRTLQDQGNLRVIMKDGVYHKRLLAA